MSEVITSTSGQNASRQVNWQADAQKPEGPPGGPAREQELSRQLEEHLSAQITRIRNQIGAGNQPDANSAEGVGRILDIRA